MVARRSWRFGSAYRTIPQSASLTAPFTQRSLWCLRILWCNRRADKELSTPTRGEISAPCHWHGALCDRDYKPGSVIDSHLSRRIVANALQPPPRKQPGRPCFLHGVAPDRVYSNGRFHADACALTARFHPYLVRRKKLHILRSAAKRHCSYIPFFLLCRQSRGFAGWGTGERFSFSLLCCQSWALPADLRRWETLLQFPMLV